MSPKLPSFPFVVLDTETTGLLPRTDHVLELAIMRYEQGEKVAEYESLFSVKKEIPPHVQVLTRVRSSDLSGKPTVTDEKKEFEKLLEGAVIVGHNILFDINMLAGEGIELDERPWIDTSMLASLVFPELQSYSLGYLSAALDLPHEPKHRAMGDVQSKTALLSKVWERLQELPEDLAKKVLEIAEKGPEGYATLFAALEAKEGKGEWIKTPQPAFHGSDYLSFLTFGSEEGKTWFTVKNLHATVQSVDKKALKNLTIAHAPQFLLEPKNAKDFLEQDIFTADELTLALKLLLFTPRTQQDLPIHGAERAVWKGKLACARDSETYKKQLEDAKGDILLDHRQLLELLANKEGPIEGDHVVIVEASMLEDTATKAFRWSCSIDPLRAAAEGDEGLTSFLDAYQILVEKVRNFQDVRYFVPADLSTPNAKGLRERLEGILSGDLTDQVRERLSDLENILDPVNLKGRIAYISQFRDGGQMVQSVPEDVAGLLKKVLYVIE